MSSLSLTNRPFTNRLLPIDNGAVVWVVPGAIRSGLAYLRLQLVFVDFNTEAWIRQQRAMPLDDCGQRLLEEFGVLVVSPLLNEEVRNGSRDLKSCRQGTRSLGIVGRKRRIVRFRHPGDNFQLRNTACVTGIRLENGRGSLFEDFLKAPFGEDALASSYRNVSLLREL